MAQLVWLITGCSSGFGEQFVIQAIARGDHVIATARNDVSRLDHLKSLGAVTFEVDTNAPQGALTSKVEQIVGVYGRIDVLVNNAGYIAVGVVEESSDDHFQAQLDTNLFGALKMTRAVLPHLRKQKSGFLVFLGSPSGWEGLPGAGPYSVSKFALEGVYECLKPEIAGFGIQSIIFEPGHFRTPIMHSNKLKYCPQTIDDYASMNQTFSSLLSGFDMHQPGDPVKAVKIMIDMVRGEGVSEGRKVPARLPIGPDVLEVIRKKCRDTLALCDEWEQVITSTNFA